MRPTFSFLIGWTLMLGSSAVSAAGTGAPSGPADNSAQGRPGIDGATPIIQFGDSMMTDERARAIGTSPDYSFLRWFPCTGNAQRCMVLEILGRRGRVFQYHLLDDRLDDSCRPVLTIKAGNPLDNSVPSQPKGVARKGPARGSPADNAAGGVNTPITGTPTGQQAGKADGCFSGYRVLARTRQENTYFGDNRQYLQKLQQTFQLVSNGRWTDVVGFTNEIWKVPVGTGGMREYGNAFAILDEKGQVIESGSDSFQAIDGSGSTDASIEARCQAKFDVEEARAKLGVQLGYDACTVVSYTLPDSITLEGALTPVGMGGVMGGTWEYPFCEPAKDTADRVVEVGTKEKIRDCIENPGRYFPKDYPPVMQPIIMHESSGYLPVIPEEISFDGGTCEPYQTKVIYFSVANLNCEVSTPYTCEEDGDGKCLCEKDETIGSNVVTICTDY